MGVNVEKTTQVIHISTILWTSTGDVVTKSANFVNKNV